MKEIRRGLTAPEYDLRMKWRTIHGPLKLIRDSLIILCIFFTGYQFLF